MDRNTLDRIHETVISVVEMLVCGQYDELEALTGGVRLRAEHIRAGIREYGRTLIRPPREAFGDIDVIPIDDRSPPEYSIRFRLFTAEEGQSDLEIQATLIDDWPGRMRVELDNILVA